MLRTVWREKLFTNSMRHFIDKEIGNTNFDEPQPSDEMQDYLDRLKELVHCLTKCFKNCISTKIAELSPSTVCHGLYEFKPFSHTCETLSSEQKFTNFFDQALLKIDWQLFANEFIRVNLSNPHFKRLVFSYNFFDYLNVQNMYADVKTMFLADSNSS